jgi:hypothetical protein
MVGEVGRRDKQNCGGWVERRTVAANKKLIFNWIQPAETPRILPEKEFGD